MNEPKITQLTFHEKDAPISVRIVPTNQNCDVVLSQPRLNISGQWRPIIKNPDPAKDIVWPQLLICHLLTGGPCCYIEPVGHPPEFRNYHAKWEKENKGGVLSMEITVPSISNPTTSKKAAVVALLVPLTCAAPSGAKAPVLALFLCSPEEGDWLMRKCLLPRRLPLVFDLDETLLSAKSISSLVKDRPLVTERLLAERERPRQEALQYHLGLMDTDYHLIEQFNTADSVFYRGRAYYKGLEPAVDEYHRPLQRPVVRIQTDDGLIVITRIVVSDPQTTMVFRIRPYWDRIHPLIAGCRDAAGNVQLRNAASLRYEVYVCTAAQKDYAIEAWRVLDGGVNNGSGLIPTDKWQRRVFCAAQTKALDKVLSLPDVYRTSSCMPFAVIIDDRTEVWDHRNRAQVLKVAAFSPYIELSHAQAGLHDVPTTHQLKEEMFRVHRQLEDLRSKMFAGIDSLTSLFPQGNFNGTLTILHFKEDYERLLQPPPWAATLLRGQQQQQQQQQLRQQQLVQMPLDPRLAFQQQQTQAPMVPETEVLEQVPLPHEEQVPEEHEQQQEQLPNRRKRKAPDGDAFPAPLPVSDPVPVLSQAAQRQGQDLTYIQAIVPNTKPLHWHTTVKLAGRVIATAIGLKKVISKQKAAAAACQILGLPYNDAANGQQTAENDDDDDENSPSEPEIWPCNAISTLYEKFGKSQVKFVQLDVKQQECWFHLTVKQEGTVSYVAIGRSYDADARKRDTRAKQRAALMALHESGERVAFENPPSRTDRVFPVAV